MTFWEPQLRHFMVGGGLLTGELITIILADISGLASLVVRTGRQGWYLTPPIFSTALLNKNFLLRDMK